jgi:hypothetical protein
VAASSVMTHVSPLTTLERLVPWQDACCPPFLPTALSIGAQLLYAAKTHGLTPIDAGQIARRRRDGRRTPVQAVERSALSVGLALPTQA